MKQYIFVLVLGLIAPVMLNAQINRVISLEYNENDFDIVEIENRVYLSTNNYITILKNDTLAPALPYICLNVLIGPDESYIDYTSKNTEVLLREGIILASNPSESFTNKKELVSSSSHLLNYTQSTYPNQQIEYTGTHSAKGYKYLTFLICPFRYDYTNKKLYLNKNVDLNIQLKSPKNNKLLVDNFIVPYNTMNIGSFFINEEHKRILYGEENIKQVPPKNYTTGDYPYKYLIITSNSLKDEFERLAQWKSTKGVKAKVLTVEEIYSNDLNSDRSNPLKIKYAIKNYYEPYNRGIEYVLLGGDINHVPVEECHIQTTVGGVIQTSLTPSDIYYSSFRNMEWDNNHNGRSAELTDSVFLDLDVAITRLPVRNSSDANNMINRIINYEKNANSNNWNNSMLLCGVKTYESVIVNGREVSDSEMQTNAMYSSYINPYWNGNLFRFYDTFTDHQTLGANYNVTKNNLQQEFMKGYSFAFVNTHGAPMDWSMEMQTAEYNRFDASSLINPHYTIFSTAACLTNDFDHNYTCLGEAFMQNENGGALAYYGCSRNSIGSSVAYFLGTDMEFMGTYHQKLFHPNSNHCLGEAIRSSKMTFVANCNDYNSTRWMYLALNAFGDPEMPVYKSTPSAIPNVTVDFNGSDLTLTTGVERPYLCLMSKYDEGNEFYYYNYGNGSPYSYDNIFHNMFGEYSFCLTKKGYLPTLALIGNTIHLQNESLSGNNNIISYHTLIGSNVTNQTSQGGVTIESGSTVITSRNDVIITGDFEVKQGGEFEIKMSSQNQVAL